jgi:hypothetical protein
MMGGIYELGSLDGFRFHKYWFRHSNFSKGDTQTHRQHPDVLSFLLFFQNKGSKLNIVLACEELTNVGVD